MLASASCIHTVRWANALAERGIVVDLLTLHSPSPQLSADVHCHRLPFRPPHGYLLAMLPLRMLLRSLRPDMLHTHYASGYGTLARLSGFHPQILSVWGSDVFCFPTESPMHRHIIRGNLRSADCVCSTSHVMARQAATLAAGQLQPIVVPFGVETDRFAPATSSDTSTDIVVGTVKTLLPNYGIDMLIRGFSACRARLRKQPGAVGNQLRLRIVGDGSERAELQRLAERMMVADVTEFAGPVSHDKVPEELNRLDIYVAMSRSESFGVAVIEALACERPVVVSDAGGLPEVVQHGETGLVVPRDDPSRLTDALCHLIQRPQLRCQLGRNGRNMVKAKYEWQGCVDQLVALYHRLLDRTPRRHAA
jgi:glycosyltransferase involved in cell wall biosynthesis